MKCNLYSITIHHYSHLLCCCGDADPEGLCSLSPFSTALPLCVVLVHTRHRPHTVSIVHIRLPSQSFVFASAERRVYDTHQSHASIPFQVNRRHESIDSPSSLSFENKRDTCSSTQAQAQIRTLDANYQGIALPLARSSPFHTIGHPPWVINAQCNL